jgi:hypothetical protein
MIAGLCCFYEYRVNFRDKMKVTIPHPISAAGDFLKSQILLLINKKGSISLLP